MGTVNKVIDSFTKKNAETGQTEIDPNAVRFLYDVLSANFDEGPDGVKCYIDYMFKIYGEKEARVFICDLFSMAYNEMVDFIGASIASAIPDIGFVLGRGVVKMMRTEFGKRKVIKTIMRYYYKKIPGKMQKLIQNKDELSNFLKKYIKIITKN